jgi:predicted Zn-dependent protease
LNRTVALLLILVAAALAFAIYSKSPSQAAPAQSASSPASLAPKVGGSKIYFVPFGAFPPEQLQPLVHYYHDKYNLEIAVLDSIPVDPSTRDQSRQQLMAEKLAGSLRSAVPEHANEPGAVLIGFTSEDIYPASKNWQFAFGWRQDGAAVVSTARLGLSNPLAALDSDVSGARLRKIVTKDIGLLYYGLPQSQNPKSVLYNQIMGIEELDQVGDDF